MITKSLKIILLNLLFMTSLFSSTLQDDIKPLTQSSFKSKQSTIENIVDKHSENPKLTLLLKNMLEGSLYYTKYKKQFVIVNKQEGKLLHTSDLFTSESLEVQKKNMFKKVKTNNKLRSFIRNKLAELNLFSKDKKVRLSSAKNMLKNVDKDSKALILKALKQEKDTDVKKVLVEMDTILKALYGTAEEQLLAVVDLSDYLSPQSLETLKKIESTTTDDEIKKLANESIESVQSSKSFYSMVETAFFGLSMGSVLLLAAIGLAITFGVMKVINMAHGEMMMIGAYTTFTLQQIMPSFIEYSIIIAIPMAFLVSAMVGVIIERLVIRHLYGRPLETLLATFGISLILQQIVRTIYSPLNQEVKTPEWMSGVHGRLMERYL